MSRRASGALLPTLLFALGLVMGTALTLGVPYLFPKVPNVEGLFVSEASPLVAMASLRLEIESTNAVQPVLRRIDLIEAQSPEPGARALRGMPVRVTVREASATIKVPEVRGLASDDAVRLLAYTGLGALSDPGPPLPARFASDPTDPMVLFENATRLAIVSAQTPAAGAMVPYGTVVRFESRFPHNPYEAVSDDMKAVLPLVAANYGAGGPLGFCGQCHRLEVRAQEAR